MAMGSEELASALLYSRAIDVPLAELPLNVRPAAIQSLGGVEPLRFRTQPGLGIAGP